MNISERLTRWITETGASAVLRDAKGDAVQPVAVQGWTFRDRIATGSAVFGPYPTHISATGIRTTVDGAYDDLAFTSTLVLPAGQVYRYTLELGVD